MKQTVRHWSFLETAALLFPLLAYLLFLGHAPLFDVDEGAFSEATREMFVRGDFLSTYLNGGHRFDKPIFIYWLQAIAVYIFGSNEFSYRLPSALAAIVWCYSVYYFITARGTKQQAAFAALIVASALGPLAIGRAATADGLLNLLLCLTMLDAWRHLEAGGKAPLLRSFFWMALGVLTKGPIAIIIPTAVTFLYCTSHRQWRQWFSAVFYLPGWVILLVVALPWYLYAWQTHGQLFIDGFFLRHNLERFSSPLQGHGGSFTYYLIALPLLALPWSGLLLQKLGDLRQDLKQPLPRFLWLWATFVLIFFSISGTKLPHYALYGMTPLFILIAMRSKTFNKIAAIAPVILLLGFFAATPATLNYLATDNSQNLYYRSLFSVAEKQLPGYYYPLIVVAILLSLIVAFSKRSDARQSAMLTTMLSSLFMIVILVPYAGNLLQGPTKRAAEFAKILPEPIIRYNFNAPSASVYAAKIIPSGEPQTGQLGLLRIDKLPGWPFQTLYQETGVLLVRRQ